MIATMPSRLYKMIRLMEILTPQIPCDGVEVITDICMDYNIGVKRNSLLRQAIGDYVVFIDDDDIISVNYIQSILDATASNPDSIGISGTITINGSTPQQWHISKAFGYWHEANGIYYRTPNHISPVRRDLALQVGFPEISFGEDADYSRRLLPLLNTEVVIPGNIYSYIYTDK